VLSACKPAILDNNDGQQMSKWTDFKVIIAMLGVGLACYLGTWFAVQQTITVEGIVILWPPNAILLAAFLVLPRYYWPFLAIAFIAAELFVSLAGFPLWAAISFTLINIFSVTLAAVLIEKSVGKNFNFYRFKDGVVFLLFAPILAACVAGLLGAAIYVLLGRSDTSYGVFWQVWWFGDALAMFVLTPLIVLIWRWVEAGEFKLDKQKLIETVLIWSLVVLVNYQAFVSQESYDLFYFTPIWWVLIGVLSAVRVGVMGAASTVTLIAMLAISMLVKDVHPFTIESPLNAVWLMQEYLAIVSIVSIGLALLLREIFDQKHALLQHKQTLKGQNLLLELKVKERTLALEEANHQLQKVNAQLVTSASTDELTGIANRRFFLSEVSRELARLTRDKKTASAIMIDLDHFKLINDQYGHEAGDRVLQAIIEPISKSIRPRDLFGRMGGEEFLVFLSDADITLAKQVAERVREALADNKVSYRGHDISVTASLGVAQWDGKSDLDELFYHADKALYQAKEKGRNRVEVVPPAHA
jgi:diguanylate cyclase (GGDEF)-like protein